jgi:hypothetical protein
VSVTRAISWEFSSKRVRAGGDYLLRFRRLVIGTNEKGAAMMILASRGDL